MKSLTIVGGTGFFGKSFIENFQQNKLQKYGINKLIIISRGKIKFSKKLRKKILYIKADSKKLSKLPETDFYIFAATSSNKKNYEKNVSNEINNIVQGIKNFLHLIHKQRLSKSKFLFLSSGAVYGANNKKLKLSEKNKISISMINNLPNEKKFYALEKLNSELMIKEFSKKYGYKFSIARCFAFYGNFLPINGHFFLSNVFKSIINKTSINLESKNLNNVYRSFMHTDDLIEWLIKINKIANKTAPIYNVGSDKFLSLYNFLKLFLKKKIIKLNLVQLKKNIQKTNIRNIDFYIPDLSKARNKLNLRIKRDLIKNSYKEIYSVIDFYKKNKIFKKIT